MGASLHYMRNQLWLGVTLAVCAVAGFGQDYKIITLAGGGVPQNVPATSASLGGAIAVATDPNRMAIAFAKAVEAGRAAHEIGLGAQLDTASATSPLTGFLN